METSVKRAKKYNNSKGVNSEKHRKQKNAQTTKLHLQMEKSEQDKTRILKNFKDDKRSDRMRKELKMYLKEILKKRMSDEELPIEEEYAQRYITILDRELFVVMCKKNLNAQYILRLDFLLKLLSNMNDRSFIVENALIEPKNLAQQTKFKPTNKIDDRLEAMIKGNKFFSDILCNITNTPQSSTFDEASPAQDSSSIASPFDNVNQTSGGSSAATISKFFFINKK